MYALTPFNVGMAEGDGIGGGRDAGDKTEGDGIDEEGAGGEGIDTILEWPMLSEETELLSDEMASFLRANPVAYAGHRIVANFVQADGYHGTTEHDEVPFLGRRFFAIALTGYWLFRRVLHLLELSNAPSEFEGHVFVMHSTRHDKRYTLTAVAHRLVETGEDALLLCSPEAEGYRKEWETDGLDTTSFIELLGAVPLAGWLSVIGTTRRSVAPGSGPTTTSSSARRCSPIPRS